MGKAGKKGTKRSNRKTLVTKHKKKVTVERNTNANLSLHHSLQFNNVSKEEANRRQVAKDLLQAQKQSRDKLKFENRGLSRFAHEAKKRDTAFEKLDHSDDVADSEEVVSKEESERFKSYYRELKKVVKDADVVLEVLDARDPLGCRCPELESMVMSSGKRLVLVLNKIDLIPRNNLEEWLEYLRKELPTVAFKASTQSQNKNLCRSRVAAIHINEGLRSSKNCVGASFLMKLLGNYCLNQKIKTKIKIGVVGFPNVGKSSVINSLKRSRSCSVGAVPGVTKTVQEVALDKHIKLIDCPGVVFAKGGPPEILALRNALHVSKLKDYMKPITAIMKRADHLQLCTYYDIPEFSSTDELLSHVAIKIGALQKGGTTNRKLAAFRLINDWNSGKIKYYTHPPEEFQQSAHISAEYVSEMGKAFDISALDQNTELDEVTMDCPTDGIDATQKDTADMIMGEENYESHSEEECDDKMEESEPVNDVYKSKKVTVDFTVKKNTTDYVTKEKVIPKHLQQNRHIRLMWKKKKKTEQKLVSRLSLKMANFCKT